MKTTAEMIAVMQAFERGEKIQVTPYGVNGWVLTPDPVWNWRDSDYRIKPREPRVIWVNEYHDGRLSAFSSIEEAQAYERGFNFKRAAVKYIEVIE